MNGANVNVLYKWDVSIYKDIKRILVGLKKGIFIFSMSASILVHVVLKCAEIGSLGLYKYAIHKNREFYRSL